MAGELPQERFAAMSAAEQFILTISRTDGKRTSKPRNAGSATVAAVGHRHALAVQQSAMARLVASFPVLDEDQIMLITDAGQTIRIPVSGDKPIHIVSLRQPGCDRSRYRRRQRVVSVERISSEPEGDDDDGDARRQKPVKPTSEE